MIFREKLVNASTGEVRQGNVLDSSLGEVEQIMIDSSLCSVMYYWVKTPDSTWRKTQYYELVENLYSIIYKVNDSIYQTYYLQEGDDVPVPEYTPATGYSWSGWLNENIPDKMPASDIVVESYTEQTDYAIIYYIDERVVYSETHHYNDSITAYVPETREHYVFSGWTGFPQSGYMPAENVTVTGTYEEDQSYVLSYYVDASVYTQQSYMSNDVIDAPDDPQVEEGYSWSGWIDLPSLMPAYDSSVHSVLTANQYILDYYVDSSLWNSLIYNYKQTIVSQTYTPAEGYLFSGWVNEPETMPAINHYRVDGMTQLIMYNVYWYIDSSLIQTGEYVPGSTVTSPVCQDDPDYVYDWNGYDTFTMPSADTSIYGEKIAKTEPVITYTVTWYIDSSLIQTAQYESGTTVTSPVCEDSAYEYNWNGYDTFVMPAADTSIYGEKIAKVVPVTSGTVTWYLDNVLFSQGTYAYDTYVMSPSSSNIKYVYEWGDYELFVMPHNDISVYGNSTKVGGTVTWYLDNAYYSSSDYLYDASVTSPVSAEIGIDYNWEYDTFLMPHYDTSIHGVREEKTGPLRKVTMIVDANGPHDYQYLRSTIYEGYYHDGDLIPCPTSQDRKFVFQGFGNIYSEDPKVTEVYTEEEWFMMRRDNVWLVKDHDVSIGIVAEKRLYSKFAVAPMQYHISVEHPTVEIGVLEPSGEVIESSTNVIDASLYFVDSNYNSIIGTNPSQVRVSMGIQVSTDGENWTLLSNNKVVMDSRISDSSIFRWDDIMHAQPYQITKEVTILGRRYIRLHVLDIYGTPSATELADCSYYAFLNYAPTGNMNTQHYIMTLSNNQRDCKFQVLGDFDSFYEHAVEQINEHFGLTAKLTNFNISMLYNMRYADLVVEHDPNNFLISGIRNPNSLAIKTDYIDSYAIETLPVFDTTPYTRTQEINPGRVQYNYHVLDSSVIMRKDMMWSRRWANCKNIIYPQDIRVTALPSSACHQMYSGCTSLRYTPPQLCSSTLGNYAYYQMFQNCTSLHDATELELPATTVPMGCYRRMFYNCENLENPPLISGRIYDREALKEMFKDCKSLKSRAVINAESAHSTAFDNMYEGCTLLPPED